MGRKTTVPDTTTLAIAGGRPVVPRRLVEVEWERFRKASQEEIDAVVAVLKSGHLSIAQGYGMPQAEGLEKEFAEWVGARYALAVNSGTAALHCAVAALGIEPGDQVIIPAYTFIASAMAAMHQNAVPVFVDVEPGTFLMDASRLEARITPRTRAIMPVHVYGLACDMDAINAVARKHNLAVIEDCAQAYGTEYRGRRAGSIGDAAGFAMTTTKHLMTGEGGLFTTNDKEVYERASMTRIFGELCDMRSKDRAYLSSTIGWNYKLPEVCSALARVKLRHLNDFVATLRGNAERLTARLRAVPGLVPPVVPAGRGHAYYAYPVAVDPGALHLDVEAGKLRNAVMRALEAENVKVGLWQKVPVPAQPIFRKKTAYGRGCPWECRGAQDVTCDVRDYPNTVAAIESHFIVKGFMPPNGSELMDRYAEAFAKVMRNVDQALDVYEKQETYQPVAQRMAALVP